MSPGIAAGPLGGAPASENIDLAESVAGEEDPGASIDMSAEPDGVRPQQVQGAAGERSGTSDRPSGGQSGATSSGQPMAPGDQAPPGTPGTGETVCPTCGGTGQRAGATCPTCLGTGKVTVGIGGA